MSGRECSYASQKTSGQAFNTDDSTPEPSTSGSKLREENDKPDKPDKPILSVPLLYNFGSREHLSFDAHRSSQPEDTVNVKHMELLIHFNLQMREMFNLGAAFLAGDQFIHASWLLDSALEYPYYLHQLLAYSACHLAHTHPNKSESYALLAVSLQTRAVSLFNETWKGIDPANAKAALVFSTCLGYHVFADTLAKRHSGSPETFLDSYVQCLNVHRGIYGIAAAAWPLLMETDLAPVLASSAEMTSRTPLGHHCQHIKQLVNDSDSLDEDGKEACRRAIKYVQIGFDAQLEPPMEATVGNRLHMIFAFNMLVPSEFTSLLVARKSAALVVLGFYALLLHHGRAKWQIGDSGKYILRIILDLLDPEWQHWLEYPRQVVFDELN